MERVEGNRAPSDVSYPSIPHLPPHSPRSSAMSLLLSLAGRYTATYTVTPSTSPKTSRRVRDSPEGGYVRSKSYSPHKSTSGVSSRFQDSLNHWNSTLSFSVSNSRPPSRVSSKLSGASTDDPSRSVSADSAFCSSCPPSPSVSSHKRSTWRPPDRSTSRLSRSLSMPCTSDRDLPLHTLPDYCCRRRPEEVVSESSGSCEERRPRRPATPGYCSGSNSSSTPEKIMKRNSLEEWILCTVKRPTLNRRVAAMNNLTLRDNIDQYHKWLQDTPEKSARLAKSRNSFRFGRKSSSASRATGISGKTGTVEVKGHSSMEGLERKQMDVIRLLKSSEDAVRKNIPEYVVGFPFIVLDSIISLTREIDQMTHNANSTELASLLSHVNQTVADHALWIDHFYLYGNDSHSNQTINTIVQNIEQAVKNLVDFVISKENQNLSNSNFFHSNETSHNESNSSLCSQDSPYSRKKFNESRNGHTHGSMPEIPSATTSFGSADNVPQNNTSPQPNKLMHSYSSDSILDNKENVTSTPTKASAYVMDYKGTSSSNELAAPPIPPKVATRGRSSIRSSYKECDPPLRQSSPCGSSFDNDLKYPHRGRAGLIMICSTPQSLNPSSMDHSLNYSPATGHDSVYHTLPHLNHSSTEDSIKLGLKNNNSNNGNLDASPPIEDLSSMLSQNCDLSSWTIGDESSSSGYTSSTLNSSRTFSHTFHSSIYENRLGSTVDALKETSSQDLNTSGSQSHLAIPRNSRNSACSSSSRSSGSEIDGNVLAIGVPPPLPMKTRQQVSSHVNEQTQSQYDNVDRTSSATDTVELRHPHFESQIKSELIKTQEVCSISYSSENSITSWGNSTSSNTPAASSAVQRRYETYTNQTTRNMFYKEKPPLPLKQKHIRDYMQTFKDYQMPETEWFQFQHRRSKQTISIILADEFKEFDLESSHSLNATRLSLPEPNNVSRRSPPALPPKQSRSPGCRQIISSERSQRECSTADRTENLPSSELCSYQIRSEMCPCQTRNFVPMSSNAVQPPDLVELCSCQIKDLAVTKSNSTQLPDSYMQAMQAPPRPPKTRRGETSEKDSINKAEKEKSQEPPPEFVEDSDSNSLMDSLNVNEQITFQGETEESDVKCASVDAFVVYATYSKNGAYLEAFLTTYRTFLTPPDLIAKLIYRYNKFACISSADYQKAAKNAFSLLVRVVHDLVVPELTDTLLEELSQFEYNLLSKGDLKLALYFRKKLSEKLVLRKSHLAQMEFSGHYLALRDQRQYTLLDFKGSDIADQMTLLDSELFSKLGVPELLYYSRDENEEQCPNLATFAMQINRMSSWVKTQILRSSGQDKEKYYKKFIKIMKHLRKVNNNFNSCIAILSGLDSIDVRRLDWPKASTDMLKEYSDLFAFEGSYRAYRQALAETKPPCIPHLGIILQDLTKLHNINPNLVDGKVNFLKRWLQFNILEDMKRFIPSKYDIHVNESIRHFINNYEDCMSDSDLWDLSLSIKPKIKT